MSYASEPALNIFAQNNLELFGLRSPHAPGFHFVGAMPNNVMRARYPDLSPSFSGAARDLARAVNACIGEAAEFYSAIRRTADEQSAPLLSADDQKQFSVWLKQGDAMNESSVTTVQNLASGAIHQVPLYPILRPESHSDRQADCFAWSNGCAVAHDIETAMLRGLLEIVERDAIALWWHGKQPRVIEKHQLEECSASALLAEARESKTDRQVGLLDLTTDIGIPCVLAMSSDIDGRNCAFGFGAGVHFSAAISSAIREMLQMELALAMVMEKARRRGRSNLGLYEQKLMARMDSAEMTRDKVLSNAIKAPQKVIPETPQSPGLQLQSLVQQIAAKGYTVLAKDITRADIGVPAAKVVVCGLQPFPSTFETDRLRNTKLGASGKTWAALGFPIL